MISNPDILSNLELERTYTSGVYNKRPVNIVRGEGALLWDADGREYIDCSAGHGVANIGHGRAEIATALALQAQRLITCPESVYNDVRGRLLERLAAITPAGLSRFFLCNSGTEAVEGALKFARLATGRTGIVATLRGFHGRTMGSLSATWEPHYREPFAPLIPGVTHIRYNDIAAAETVITHETAAVLLELVQGEGGVHIATQEYVHRIADLCHERGALLIIDEVQTGFGRTGRMFACEHYNLTPDILCLAKSIAGGIPMGAICLGSRIIESGRITPGAHGSTFGGNPLACAAALETLAILEREQLPARAASSGAYLLERLQSLQLPIIREVRGLGLMIGIELRTRVQPYLEALLANGVLALPAGPNVIRLLPPLVITQRQIDHVVDVIADVVGADLSRPHLQPPQSNTVVGADLSRPHLQPPQSNTVVGADVSRPHLQPPQSNTVVGADVSRPHLQFRSSDPLRDNGTGNADAIHRPLPVSHMNGLRNADAIHRPLPEVALLQDMLTIPSYYRHEGTLARYLVQHAQHIGLNAHIDDAGNMIAQLPGTSQHLPPIVLLGHMDTVTGVIPVRLEDGLLYGRGAVDAKGPLAAFLCATARLIGNDTVRRPIVIIGAVEEETATSRGAHAVVNRYHPHACIIGEPSGSHAVTIGYKGRLLVEGCVERNSSHSAGPQQNSSEIAASFWERVRNHASTWNEQHAGNSAFATLQPSLRSIASDQNGLTEQTRFLIGYRLPPAFPTSELQVQLLDWAQENDIHLNFSGEEAAFQSNRTTPLARAFIGAIRAIGGQSATFKHKTGTSDMNVVGPVWGQNIVAYGPGDSSLDHTPNEHIRIDEYLHAIDVLEHVLLSMTQQQEGNES